MDADNIHIDTTPDAPAAVSHDANPQVQNIAVTNDTAIRTEMSGDLPNLFPSLPVTTLDTTEATAARDAMRWGKLQSRGSDGTPYQRMNEEKRFGFDDVAATHENDTSPPTPTPVDVLSSLSSHTEHTYHDAYTHQSTLEHEFGPKNVHVFNRYELHKVAKHESLDYHTTHNDIWVRDQFARFAYDYKIYTMARWLMAFVIAIVIGFIAFILRALVEIITNNKFNLISNMIRSHYLPSYDTINLVPSFFVLMAINVGACMVGSVLVIFYAPAAGGSGIPEVKAYLNGSNIPHVFTLASLVTKIVGIVSSISSSLVVGADPMVHTGAMIGGWLSQARLCRSCHQSCRRRQARRVLRRMERMRHLEGLNTPTTSSQHTETSPFHTQPTSSQPSHKPKVSRLTVAEAITTTIEMTTAPVTATATATAAPPSTSQHTPSAASQQPHTRATSHSQSQARGHNPSLPHSPSRASSHPSIPHAPSPIDRRHYPLQRRDSMDDICWDQTPNTWDIGGHITAFLTAIQQFRNDRDRRDYIALGAACGLASVFDSPVGGTLMVQEEIGSFYTLSNNWLIFFAAIVSSFTTNFFLAGVNNNNWGEFDASAFIVFHTGFNEHFYIWEILVFFLVGVGGGLLGILFVRINVMVNRIRKDMISPHPWYRLIEVISLVIITTIAIFWLCHAQPCTSSSLLLPDGSVPIQTGSIQTIAFTCDQQQTFNPVATLLFTGHRTAIRRLFSRSTAGLFSIPSLLIVVTLLITLIAITNGCAAAGGLIIPLITTGGVYGRIIGELLHVIIPGATIDPGVYAICGAAAFASGTTRMTMSLTLVIVELTGDLFSLLPIVIVILVAKYVGEFGSDSIYESMLKLNYIPYLPTDPIPQLNKLRARDVMNPNLLTISLHSRVDTIMQLLIHCRHNAFPVVDKSTIYTSDMVPSSPMHTAYIHGIRQRSSIGTGTGTGTRTETGTGAGAGAGTGTDTDKRHINTDTSTSYGTLVGMITRKELTVLLAIRAWARDQILTYAQFRSLMNRPIPPISILFPSLTTADRGAMLDLGPYMDHSPTIVHQDHIAALTYRIFRAMSLRHLPVVDSSFHVVGMITRKDLLKPVITKRLMDLIALHQHHPERRGSQQQLASPEPEAEAVPVADPSSPHAPHPISTSTSTSTAPLAHAASMPSHVNVTSSTTLLPGPRRSIFHRVGHLTRSATMISPHQRPDMTRGTSISVAEYQDPEADNFDL